MSDCLPLSPRVDQREPQVPHAQGELPGVLELDATLLELAFALADCQIHPVEGGLIRGGPHPDLLQVFVELVP